ncbi:MAG TPA: substrate-binding domain-containing protein [Acidimicrobiales bacterium]|nr:substrate-binding domain-containing protein [Acidimicrobiales bacterium]
MKRTLLRGGALLVAALGMSAASLVSVAPPAGATTTGVVVTSAGSDTSEGVMTDIMNTLNNNGTGTNVTVNGATTAAKTFNIPASPAVYSALPGNKFTVPGESATATDCPNDIDWVKDPAAPSGNTALSTGARGTAPFGSTAGRNYLATESGGTGPAPNGGPAETAGQNFGCIDVARSSSGPRGAGAGDKSTFRYYAFALDALTWATTSTKAPLVLTHQQIRDIYLCNVTNWNQVGGQDGPIVRYLPQAGSGTRSFFISDVLANVTPDNSGNCAGGGDRTLRLVEENQALTVTSADQDKAILPYSAALWAYQTSNSSNPTLDKRCPFKGACARLGYMTTTGGNVTANPVRWNDIDGNFELDTSAGGVVKDSNVKQFQNNSGGPAWNESTGSFIGVRYIYNVLDKVGGGAGRRGYQAALALLGFDNTTGGSKGVLCNNASGVGIALSAFIISAGFAPLTSTINAISNAAGSNCREYPGVD